MKKLFCLALFWLILSGCGYQMGASPYGLAEPLTLSIPIAENPSRFDELGPLMTRDLIAHLNRSPGITIHDNAPATLKVRITNLAIEGGSWQVTEGDDVPEGSASRIAIMDVEAVFTKPGPDGRDSTRRQKFSSRRTFIVSNDQAQVEMREREALKWITNDISQKIALTLLSEF